MADQISSTLLTTGGIIEFPHRVNRGWLFLFAALREPFYWIESTEMLNEYAEYYRKAAQVLSEFGSSLSKEKFHGEQQAVEVFCLVSLSLCSSHCKAISLLLDNNLGAESIIVTRNFMELLGDCCWISEERGRNEQNERALILEGHPYSEIAKEIRHIEKVCREDKPAWYSQVKAQMDDVAKNSPSLLNSSKALDFKKAPNLVKRMGPDARIRFYHVYRTASMFTHPTPILKAFFVQQVGSAASPDDKISKLVQQHLAYGLLFLKLILSFCDQAFSEYAIEGRPFRTGCCERLNQITNQGNHGQYSDLSRANSL